MFKHLTLVTLTGIALIGCDSGDANTEGEEETSAADVGREVEEAAEAAGSFARQVVRDYKSTMTDKLEQAATRIESLEERTAELADDARADVKKMIDDVDAKRKALQRELESLPTEQTQEAWEKVKSQLDQSWTELNDAIDDAVDQLDGEQRSNTTE